MENRLRNYFPLIRERKEVLKEIGESSGLKALFRSWTPERQEEFLDFCTGMKGVKILYDSFLRNHESGIYTRQAEPFSVAAAGEKGSDPSGASQ
ncbi:MAG: hypothetical protein ACLSA0_13565 [Eisenbergiella massiliensis]